MEDGELFNLDSPKRHSDPAPCTSKDGHSTATAFTFSVPDLRNYGSSRASSTSPNRSPLLDGVARASTPSPARHSPAATRRGRGHKHRRFSHGAVASPGTISYFSTAPRRATHPNTSPGRYRRGTLWHDEDPWHQYRTRASSIPIPNGDDKPFMAEEGGYYRLRSFSVTSKGIVNLGDFVRARSPSVTSDESSSGVEQDFRDRLSSVESTMSQPPTTTRYKVLLLGAEEVGKTSLVA
ncbi:hypothetical protein X975_01531, partial [Stegodyphus mimosarum]